MKNIVQIELFALAACAFAIGTSEFVIMGILPEVANSLKVSLPKSGWLVSGYAIGVAVGAPLLVSCTNKLGRKTVLQLLMANFILGNLLCAIAPNYELLMISRIITSFTHGAFFGIGSIVAADLVSKEKRASAIALMFTGLTLANILGVPLGTFIGQFFSWRVTFWFVLIIGIFAFIILSIILPRNLVTDNQKISFKNELQVFKSYDVWLSLLTTLLGFAGVFTVLTYISPLLTQISNFEQNMIAPALLLFGAGLTVGNVLGGKLVDKFGAQALLGILLSLMLIMLMFYFTIYNNHFVVMLSIFIWGVVAFATVPALQMRILGKAQQCPNIASTLNIGAFNLGNALGAWVGGVIITMQFSIAYLCLAAGWLTLLSILVVMYHNYLDVCMVKRNRVYN